MFGSTPNSKRALRRLIETQMALRTRCLKNLVTAELFWTGIEPEYPSYPTNPIGRYLATSRVFGDQLWWPTRNDPYLIIGGSPTSPHPDHYPILVAHDKGAFYNHHAAGSRLFGDKNFFSQSDHEGFATYHAMMTWYMNCACTEHEIKLNIMKRELEQLETDGDQQNA